MPVEEGKSTNVKETSEMATMGMVSMLIKSMRLNECPISSLNYVWLPLGDFLCI